MSGKSGHCLCGAVSYEYDGPENWRGHCHCESCRRNTSAPFTTYFGVSWENFKWTGKMPKVFQSSPGVKRHFCGTCGTPMAYEAEKFSHEIHLYAASLDDPRDFQPDFHVFDSERLPWIQLSDHLPRFEKTGS
jgi:hypothetical protein